MMTMPVRCDVVLPGTPDPEHAISPCAARVVGYLRNRAEVFAPQRTQLWMVGQDAPCRWRLHDGRPAVRDASGTRLRVVVNPAFLLQDRPPFAALVERAEAAASAWCANPCTGDRYAFAWRDGAVSDDIVSGALRALTATVATGLPFGECDDFAGGPPIPPGAALACQSPALDGVANVRGRRYSDAPVYVNTALFELLKGNANRCQSGGGLPDDLSALRSLRAASRAPWLFNALINEIEYRTAVVAPDSIPPEVHLSLTGACNLECRFCAYTHANAIRQFTGVARVSQLDFLRNVQTLRLSSGLGEPTLNKDLPEIIRFLAGRFPQLGLNFFTNGIALHRRDMIDSLLDRVRWINVSLNAASADSWKTQHQADHFGKVCDNLLQLRRARRERGAVFPLVFSSIVVNRRNLADLPRMPALCRRLGIDRLSAFPYSALGYHTTPHTFGPEETLENSREAYDDIHEETLREGALHRVSLELPLHSSEKNVKFGMEARRLHDFAGIERNEWPLTKLADAFFDDPRPATACHFLWRIGCIGSTHNANRARDATHYMYPCIGPLSSADLSRVNAFDFPGEAGFSKLWNNEVFRRLRLAQTRAGVSTVCDKCRCSDSRDRENFPAFERLVAEFMEQADPMTSAEGVPPTVIPIRAAGFR
jgi:MoaA/NifB/PqqE/SkfB family radical SAM enzyme